MRPEHKAQVRKEVIQRILQAKICAAENGVSSLQNIINDTVYHERNRLAKEKRRRARRREMRYWKGINKQILKTSEEQNEQILEEIIAGFTDEIMGHFNPKVYKFVTSILPGALGILLNTTSPSLFFSNFPHLPDISNRVIVQGEIEHLRALEKIGTLVLVPTHPSNMDSIIVGLSLFLIGLPPFTYGAGLNLFTNWIISYFMRNLGAYKVDRNKISTLYKEVLKEYATVTIEMGYHNLFFPSGGRVRSGGIETKLKLGLLGTALKAYINNLKQGKEKPNIYVVPCTISYQLVLEAEHLSEDFLKQTGKSRYIIEDDEFSQLRRWLNFISSIIRLDSRIYTTFCPPMDLFGNRVDYSGASYDRRGRIVDSRRYVMTDGEVDHQEQRDQEYTRQLGQEILQAFRKNNVIMSTNLLSFVVYKLMQRHRPDVDFYRLLRTGDNLSFHIDEVHEAMAKVLDQVMKRVERGELRIDERLMGIDVPELVERGLKHSSVYHTKPIVIRKDDKIYPNYCNLVLFYHNRLDSYGITID